MTQQPKRIPGERNPSVDSTEVRHILNAASASAGAGPGDFGARSAFSAWDRWRERRRKRKAIAAYQAAKREQ